MSQVSKNAPKNSASAARISSYSPGRAFGPGVRFTGASVAGPGMRVDCQATARHSPPRFTKVPVLRYFVMTAASPLPSVPTNRKATIAVSPYCWMRMSSAAYVVGCAAAADGPERAFSRISALPTRTPAERV